MIDNRLQLSKPHLGESSALDFISEEEITRKDPIILCALVIIGLIGFLYVLHCLNRNDFSPKYIQKSSFELSYKIDHQEDLAAKQL